MNSEKIAPLKGRWPLDHVKVKEDQMMNQQAMTQNAHNARGRRAACYLRVASSSDSDGAAIARQRAACEELARKLGLDMVHIYTDIGSSGVSGNRPGLNRMLSDLETHGDVDVVLTQDSARISRNIGVLHRILAKLDARGVQVRTVKDSAMLNVTSTLAQFIAEAVHQERSAAAKRGWAKRRLAQQGQVANG
jgi:DNA invertase Pin-like site-specific DNA recombinase